MSIDDPDEPIGMTTTNQTETIQTEEGGVTRDKTEVEINHRQLIAEWMMYKSSIMFKMLSNKLVV